MMCKFFRDSRHIAFTKVVSSYHDIGIYNKAASRRFDTNDVIVINPHPWLWKPLTVYGFILPCKD